MSSNYIKVTVCPGLNLRPSISFVDRMRVEADGRQLTEDVERKLTMVLAKKVFAPQIEYIEWEMNRLAEMPYNIGTFYEAEEFFRRIIADYDASHKQTVEMELETLIRKEERRFPEMQDSGSAKIIPVKVKFRETRSRIGIFEYTGKMKIFPSGKTGCSTTINTRRMGRNERKTSRNPALPVLRSESVPHCRKKGGRQYRNR